MSMAALPVPLPLPHHYRRGGGSVVADGFLNNHRDSGRFFLELNAKMHESEQKFSVR
jgi:hypothetical protein